MKTIMHQNSVTIIGTNNSLSKSFVPDGSIIIAIDGIAVKNMEDVEFICDGLKINSFVPVTINTVQSIKIIPVCLTSFYNPSYIIISLFLCTLVIVVSGIVILKRPASDKSAWVFHGLMLSLFCILSMTWGSYIYPNQTLGMLTRIIFSSSYALLPAFFVWFTFVFPKEKWSHAAKLIIPLFVFAGILSVAMSYSFILGASLRSVYWFDIYTSLFNICRVFFAASVIFSVGNFIHSYKYAAEESERRKLRWIFLGTLIGPLSFVFLWQLPQLITSSGLVPEEFILLCTSAIPLTYGFSIVRYHVFDIDLIFKRSTVYASLVLLFIFIYAILVGGVTIIIGRLTVFSSVILSAVASVISALLFQPVKGRIMAFVDKKFFVVQYSFSKEQNEIAVKLDSCPQIEDVANLVISEIQKVMPLQQIAIRVLMGGQKIYADSTKSFEEASTLRDYIPEHLTLSMNQPGWVDNIVEKGSRGHIIEKSDLAGTGFCGYVPLVSKNGDMKAVVFVGRKKSQFVFSHEDVSLLLFIFAQAAAALERIELNENLFYEKAVSTKLQELNELKSHFVSSVSHELKTPLTSIRMFSEILGDTGLPPNKQKEYLNIISGETERLTRLINNILDFAKIEKNIKEYTFREIDIVSLVKDVLHMMAYQLQMNSFSVHQEYSQDEIAVMADKDALIEACINLISNAIKYSADKKEIKISVSTNGQTATIAISDKGIGIPEEKMLEIFEPYHRLDSGKSTGAEGTGLGLSIVKHIMMAHNGEAGVTSIVGEGSTFTLSIPVIT